MKATYNLEKRLIEFSIKAIQFIEKLCKSPSNKHLGNQLLRSTTSAALNYGEAQSAESRKDFIHKCKIVLKELRESAICLQIIQGSNNHLGGLDLILNETNELISIFMKCVQTAQKNNK